MSFQNIIGHERPVEILKTAIRNNRLAHAYLFHGEDGVGKRLVATAFAQAADCPSTLKGSGEASDPGACGHCESCRHIQSGTHPDLIIVKPEGIGIKIAQIRALQERMQLKPLSGPYRFVILEEAETMRDEAANALLKTLEEPPDCTVLILITSQLHAMLQTVVSRCQRIRFGPIAEQKILQLLRQRHQAGLPLIERVVALAMGRIGPALELDPQNIEGEWRKFNRVLLQDPSPGIGDILEFAQEYGQDRDMTERALQWIGLWLRDLVAFKLNSSSPCRVAESSSPQFRRTALILDVEEILSFADWVRWIWSALARNINRQLALEVLLMHIRYAAGARK